jgi:hypothetical protein
MKSSKIKGKLHHQLDQTEGGTSSISQLEDRMLEGSRENKSGTNTQQSLQDSYRRFLPTQTQEKYSYFKALGKEGLVYGYVREIFTRNTIQEILLSFLANVPAYFASMTFFSIYMDILLLGLKKKRKKYQDFKQRQTRLKHSDKENS